MLNLNKAVPVTGFTIEDVRSALLRAAKGRARRRDVRPFTWNPERSVRYVTGTLRDGSYLRRMRFDRLRRRNNNGKEREILWPSFYTLVLQHLALAKMEELYSPLDPNVGLNCKKGCGITASRRKRSVTKRLKHVFYDRRDYEYIVVMDQRQCYDHITAAVLRRALKYIGAPRWFNDYAVGICFHEGRFPIGAPTSPLAHHAVMLASDRKALSISPLSVRYADDLAMPCRTREEAQAAKWRIKNHWWYELGIRSKRQTVRVQSMTVACDFCGEVFVRNAGKGVCDHNKGYTLLRGSIASRAVERSNERSYPSYFGLLKSVDGYGLMRKIERSMNLKELTEKIRINRRLDAPNIAIKDLAESGIEFAVHDYEIRYDKNREANWIKCLISYKGKEAGGRRIAREFHGNFQGIIGFHLLCEREFGKEALLPMTRMRIENSCGYIYAGSTNMEEEIDDDEIYNR